MRSFLYTMDFAIRGLLRQKTKNLSICCLFALIVFLFSGIDFMCNAVYQETLKAVRYQPAIIVQNMRAGRQVPIDLASVDRIGKIFGVAGAWGRIWGYYFDPYTGANYTIVGDPGDLVETWELTRERGDPGAVDQEPAALKDGEALIGEGVRTARRLSSNGVLNFQNYAGNPVSFRVSGSFAATVSLWTHDLIVLTERDARQLFGLDPGAAWDIAVDVPNEIEVPKVGEKIVNAVPGARVIATKQLERTYGSSYGFRSGVLLSTSMVCLLAFLILAYDRVARLSREEQQEIAILKALGWQTRDVIRLSMLQSVILSLTGFLAGVILSYYHVFFTGAPLLRIVFSGWSVLYPPHPLPPSLDLSKLFGLMFLTVVPYMAVGIIPVWRASVKDPDEVFRS